VLEPVLLECNLVGGVAYSMLGGDAIRGISSRHLHLQQVQVCSSGNANPHPDNKSKDSVAREAEVKQEIFARYYLTLAPPATVRAASTPVRDGRASVRLGIGNELKRVSVNPKNPYKLATMEDVLARKDTVLPCWPELRPPG
jgi:hypothetical protein